MRDASGRRRWKLFGSRMANLKWLFVTLISYAAVIVLCSVAAVPVLIIICLMVTKLTDGLFSFWGLTVIALSISIGYFLFGLLVLSLIILACRLIPGRRWEGVRDLKDSGNAGFFLSAAALVFADHLFLPMIRGTPLITQFYRGMGARIGSGTVIATTKISDCELLEIGDNCIIGGDCVINCHSAERGSLIRKRVRIGNRVTIGQYTTILPGVQIEDDVVVGANTLVPKNRILTAGNTYGGVPATLLSKKGQYINQPQVAGQFQDAFIDTHKENPKIEGPIDNFAFLMESYKLRHNEVLAVESFVSQIVVASLTTFAGLFLYSVINDKDELLAFLPILVSLSGLVLCVLMGALNTLGYHMSKIEIAFRNAGAKDFDWEMREGAMGKPRTFTLPGLLIIVIYFSLYAVPLYLTFRGPLLPKGGLFLGYSLRTIYAVVDTTLGLACLVSFASVWIQSKVLRKKLPAHL